MVSTPEIFQALFGRAHDIVWRKGLRDADAGRRRPDPVFRRDFGRDVNLTLRFRDHSADQFFAVSVSVHERGIDEIHAEFDRVAKGGERFSIGSAHPHGSSDAPGAIADGVDVEIRTAEFAIFHGLAGFIIGVRL